MVVATGWVRRFAWRVAFVASLLALTLAPSAMATTSPSLPFSFVSDAYPMPPIDVALSPFASTSIAPRIDPGAHDEAGVRMRIVDGRLFDYPGGQASWGVDNLNSYLLTGDRFFLDRATAQAQRLIDTSLHVGDAWFFPSMYGRDRHGHVGDPMVPPWFSCLGQGTGLALFCRLHAATGDPRYRDAATGAFNGFLSTGPVAGPWLVTIDESGFLWFEEWPKPIIDHTINGHGYAAFGVYEYWRAYGDERARALFSGAATTLRHYLPAFRVPGWVSHYCLLHGTANRKYHLAHTQQFLKLYTLTGDARFARGADLLWHDFPDPLYFGGRCRVAAGTYAAFRFRANGDVIEKRRLRVPRTRIFAATSRQRVRGRGIFVQIADGRRAGYWVRERPPKVYALGQSSPFVYSPPRRLRLAPGVEYTGRVIDAAGSVVEERRLVPAAGFDTTMSRRAAVNGVDSVLVDAGPLDGCWLPVAGLLLD